MAGKRSLIESLEGRQLFSTMTANFNALGGALNKPGLGSLFGVTSLAGGSNKGLVDGTQLTVSAPMDKPASIGTNPFALSNIASILSGTRTKAIIRYADMLDGFPYNWISVADWDSKVTSATNTIKNNATYKSVIRCIAVFNEPDANFGGAFLSDPTIGAPVNDKYARINWLWTHTANLIRGIDNSIPLMGPNFLFYNPQLVAGEGTVMQNFMQNARDTNTLPDMVGWHPLLTTNPADVRLSVNAYRATESSLGISARPIVMEEYGINNGKFAGVPSSMLPFWAEMERSGVSYASAGVYDNGGTLGGTARYWSETNQQVNAGYFMHNWYMNMAGQLVPTTAGNTRYVGAYDGVASWDAASQTGTILLGGPDDLATISLQGIAAKLGNSVHVKVEMANWTVDTNEPNSTLEHAGDPITSPIEIYNKVLTPDASGNLNLPLHVEAPNGYRITLTRDDRAPRYEAEDALLVNAPIVTNAAPGNASNSRFVTLSTAGSPSATITAIAPRAGSYTLTIGYAAATSAVIQMRLNGSATGPLLTLPATGTSLATASASEFTTTVTLATSVNSVELRALSNTIQLDYVALVPRVATYPIVLVDPPTKYEAEEATRVGVVTYASGTNAANPAVPMISSGTGYVGGINNTSQSVTFLVNVLETGFYDMTVRYAANLGAATHTLLVNYKSQGEVPYPATNGWSGTDLRTTTKLVALHVGPNLLTFSKGTSFAEIDFISLSKDTHRYEAAGAELNSVSPGVFPKAYTNPFKNFVGGINDAGDSVTFTVDAPAAGQYILAARYANGSGAAATHAVSVNGVAAGTIAYATTSGWFGNFGPIDQKSANLVVSLAAGLNQIKFEKATGFAELQYLVVAPSPPQASTPSVPVLAAGSDSGVSASDRITNVAKPTFTGTADPGSAVAILGPTTLGNTVTDATGHWSITLALPLHEGANILQAIASNDLGVNFSVGGPTMTVTLDTIAPTVSTPQFIYDTGYGIVITANEALDAAFVGTLPTLINRDGGATPTLVRAGASGSEARFTFSTTPVNGNYDVTAVAGALLDIAGNVSSAPITATFFVLAGDANRSRSVDFDDLLVVAANYALSGKTFSQGDFNNSGGVDFDDLLILAKNYGVTLAPPAAAMAAATSTTRRRSAADVLA